MYFLKSYELFNNNQVFVLRAHAGAAPRRNWRISSSAIRNYFTESASKRSHKTGVQLQVKLQFMQTECVCAGGRALTRTTFIMNDI